jgi:hypothetical protein
MKLVKFNNGKFGIFMGKRFFKERFLDFDSGCDRTLSKTDKWFKDCMVEETKARERYMQMHMKYTIVKE